MSRIIGPDKWYQSGSIHRDRAPSLPSLAIPSLRRFLTPLRSDPKQIDLFSSLLSRFAPANFFFFDSGRTGDFPSSSLEFRVAVVFFLFPDPIRSKSPPPLSQIDFFSSIRTHGDRARSLPHLPIRHSAASVLLWSTTVRPISFPLPKSATTTIPILPRRRVPPPPPLPAPSSLPPESPLAPGHAVDAAAPGNPWHPHHANSVSSPSSVASPSPRMCASSLIERPDMAPLLALPKANSTSFTEMKYVLHASTIQSAEAQAQAEATISKDVSRAVLDLEHRLEAQLARDRTSFDTIKGELAKLTSMASQFALSISKQTNSAIPTSSSLRVTGTAPVASKVFDTMPTSSSGCSKVFGKQSSAAVSSPTTSGSSRFGASGSTYAAPQVFGETPTSSLWQGTHGSVPDCCSGRHNSSLSACVSNFSEQNFDETSQQYDFTNLSLKTVSRADGTKQSYYALPENYPLARSTSKQMSAVFDDKTEDTSNESVDVFAIKPEKQTYEIEQLDDKKASVIVQQPYDEAQKEGEPLLRCLSKVLETEHTSACLNITSHECDLSFELQQQDEERVYSSPVIKASNSSTTRSSQLNIEHSMRELRMPWDPGALLPRMSF